MGKQALAAILLGMILLLSACGTGQEESSQPAEEESPSESLSAAEETSEAPSLSPPDGAQDRPTAEAEVLASIQGLPDGFTGTNRDQFLEYFVFLLESGLDDPLDPDRLYDFGYDSPVVVAGSLQQLYLDAAYLSETDLRVLDTAQTDPEGNYRLRVDVADGGDHFRAGEQDWHLHVGYPPFGDGITVTRLTDEAKAKAMQDILAEYEDDVDRMIDMRRIAFIDTFDSPADLDPEDRTGYMIVNLPPSGTFGSNNEMTYITQDDMDTWSQQLFGISPHVDPESRFYDSVSYQDGPENVYSMYYGWGPPIIDPVFVHRVEQGGDVHYYFEEYYHEVNGDRTATLPARLLRFTMRDGMVWSCVDVSDSIPPSFYLEDLLDSIDAAA